jgi:hypothetical protein
MTIKNSRQKFTAESKFKVTITNNGITNGVRYNLVMKIQK